MTILQNMQWNVAETLAPTDDGKQLSGRNRLEDLIERNAQFDAFKVDYELPATGFALGDDSRFTVAGSEKTYSIEDSALEQLCARLGQPYMNGALPRNYTKALIESHPALYKTILADHAAGYGKQVFLRTYDSTVRAVMSDRFTHIDNADVLGMMKEYLDGKDGGQYELVRPYIGRDSMNVRVMVKAVRPKDGDGHYGLGYAIRTGEIGNVSPQVLPFVQRGPCTNSTIWQEGGITLKQSGNREGKLMMLAGAMGEAIAASAEMIKRLMEARYQKLPSLNSIVSDLAEKFGWSEEVTLNVAAGSEQDHSLFGLVNGLTSAAHKSGLDADNAIALEMLGGKLLMQPEYVRAFDHK